MPSPLFEYENVAGHPFPLVMLVDTSGNPYNASGAPPTPTSLTTVTSIETGPFTIAAGAVGYSVINYGAAAGIFNGVALASGDGDIENPASGFVYGALSGDATGTTFKVQRVA